MRRPSCPAEFRRKVLDLLAERRSVASVAHDLDVSDQTIYKWRRQTASTAASSPARAPPRRRSSLRRRSGPLSSRPS